MSGIGPPIGIAIAGWLPDHMFSRLLNAEAGSCRGKDVPGGIHHGAESQLDQFLVQNDSFGVVIDNPLEGTACVVEKRWQ
jgi:hypothetical protein